MKKTKHLVRGPRNRGGPSYRSKVVSVAFVGIVVPKHIYNIEEFAKRRFEGKNVNPFKIPDLYIFLM